MKYSIFFLLFLLGTVSPQDPAATETEVSEASVAPSESSMEPSQNTPSPTGLPSMEPSYSKPPDYTLPNPVCTLKEVDPQQWYSFACEFSGIVKPKCATVSMEIRNGLDCKEEYDLKQHNQVVKVDNEAEGLDESDQTVYLAEAAIHPKEPKEDDVTAVLSEEEIKFCLYVKLENCEGNLMLFKEIKVTLLKGIMGTLELEGLTNAKFEDTVEETVTTNSDLKLEAYRCKKNPTDVEDVVEDPLEGNKVLNICIEIDEAAGPAEYMLGEVLELELKKEATSEADKNVFNFDRQENFNKEVVFDLFKEEQRMMVGLKLPIDFFLDVRPITASGKIALKDPISRRLLQNTNIDTAKDSKFSSKIEVSSNHDIYASSSASKSNLMVLVLFSVTTMLLN
uniref:Uncharacterized protein n=1 Tax=Eucampia antarctica TaxID=49252 RepID=A0A7S2R0T6_9STRA